MSGSEGIDLLTFGETMVSFRSGAPATAQGAWQAHVAGAESTVAIALGRLGHDVTWVGRVGDDPFGELIAQQLRGQGIRVVAVIDERRPTGLMFVERRTADLARVTYRRTGSAGSALEAGDVVSRLDGARIVHLSGITPALSDTARGTALTVAETLSGSAAGSRPLLSLDVNYRSRLWSLTEARPVLRQLAAAADIVIASDDELALLADDATTSRAAEGTEQPVVSRLLTGRARMVAVKRGPRGATLYTVDGRFDAPALSVRAVDELGAGDAFSAGLLSGVLDGLAPQQSLSRAATLGAFAVSTAGDWEGLPSRAELPLLDGRAPGDVLR